MLKKILGLGIALVMLFSLMACSDIELAQYKTIARATIQTYADSKVQSEYTAENWALIDTCVAKGKDAVNAAKDKIGVDIAIEATKTAINKVQYFENSDFLSCELQKQIKLDYLNLIVKPMYPDAKITDVKIDKYYGMYDYVCMNCDKYNPVERWCGTMAAVMISDTFNDHSNSAVSILLEDWRNTWLEYNDGRRIFLWEDNSILELSEAVEQEIDLDYLGLWYLHETDLPLAAFYRARDNFLSYFNYEHYTRSWLVGYYGTYSGASVLTPNIGSAIDKITFETIADVNFIYRNLQIFNIIKGTDLYSLQQAYDVGWLTVLDLVSIKEAHKAQFPALYEYYGV